MGEETLLIKVGFELNVCAVTINDEAAIYRKCI